MPAQTLSSSLENADTIQMDYLAEFAYAGASNLETYGPCAHSKIGKVKHPSEAVESNVCFLLPLLLLAFSLSPHAKVLYSLLTGDTSY